MPGLVSELLRSVDLSKPLAAQLGQNFTLAPWDEKLYSKKTWTGFVASLLRTPFEKKTLDRKIRQIFVKSMQSLSENEVKSFTPEQARSIRVFMTTLSDKERSKFQSSASLSSIPEIVELKKKEALKNEELKHQSKEEDKPADSYLRNNPGKKDFISSRSPQERLRILFETFGTLSPEYLEELDLFLKSHPEEAKADYKAFLEPFKIAFKEHQERIKALSGKTTAQLAQKEEKRANFALSLEQTVQNLKLHEKKQICFSYGNAIQDLDSLINSLDHLPQELINLIPPELLNYLKGDKSESSLASRYLRENIPNRMPLSKLTLITPLLSDATRKLPSFIEQKLPKLLKEFLEERVKEGPLVTISHLLPTGGLKSGLSSFGSFGRLLMNKEYLEHFLLNKLDEGAKKLLPLQEINDTLHKLPILVQKMLGLTQGPLWFEIEKTGAATFKLTVTSLGEALNFHPVDDQSKKPFIKLHITDIQAEKLNEEFFEAILKKQQANSQMDVDSIYEEILKELNGKIAPNSSDEMVCDNSECSTPATLLNKQIFKKSDHSLFTMKWEAYLAYCLTLQKEKGGSLNLKNSKDSLFLKSITSQIEIEYKKTALNDPKIEATLLEVKKALELAAISNKSVKASSPTLKLAQSAGLDSKEMLETLSSTANFVFGDAIGQVVESIVDEISENLPEGVKPLPPTFFQKVKLITYDVVQLYFMQSYVDICWDIGLLTLIATSIYTGGTAYLVPLAWPYISYLLPPEVSACIERLKSALIGHICHAIKFVAWTLIYDEEAQKEIQEWVEKMAASLSLTERPLKLTLDTPQISPTPIKTDQQTQVTLPLMNEVVSSQSLMDAKGEEILRSSFIPNFFEKPLDIENLEAHTFQMALSQIIFNADKIDPAFKFEEDDKASARERIYFRTQYVIKKILELPVPAKHQITIWDKLATTKKLAEQLFKLKSYFNKEVRSLIGYESGLDENFLVAREFITAIFHHFCPPDTTFIGMYSENLVEDSDDLYNRYSLPTIFSLEDTPEVVFNDPQLLEIALQVSNFIKYKNYYKTRTHHENIVNYRDDFQRIFTKDSKRLSESDDLDWSINRLTSPFQNLYYKLNSNLPLMHAANEGRIQLALKTFLEDISAWKYLTYSDIYAINIFDKFFNRFVFGNGKLKTELLQNPQLAKTLGEFFHELIDQIEEQRSLPFFMLEVCKIGKKCLSFVTYYQPEAAPFFPDFENHLSLFIKQAAPLSKTARVALLLKDPSPFDEAYPLHCLKSILLKGKLSEYGFEIASKKEIQHKLTLYLCFLQNYFKNLDDRNKVINSFLADFPLNPDNSDWFEISDLVYQQGLLQLDLRAGTLTGIQNLFSPLHFALKSSLVDVFGEEHLKEKFIQTEDTNRFGTLYDGEHTIVYVSVISNHEIYTINCHLMCTRDFDGIKATLVQSTKKLNPVVFDANHKTLISYWKNENNLFVQYKETGSHLFKFQTFDLSAITEDAFEDPTPSGTILVERRLLSVPSDDLKNSFACLEAVCPLNNISCFAYENETLIDSFILLEQNLKFKVKLSSKGPKAFGVIPGYYIADKQIDPLFTPFAKYLILENEGGQKAAIIVKSHFATALASRATRFATKGEGFLKKQLKYLKLEKFQTGYLIVTTTQNPLKPLLSDKFSDLTYLYFFYMAEGKIDLCKGIADELENKLMSSPLSEEDRYELENGLYYLSYLPINFEGALQSKCRMQALLEMNRHLNPVDPQTLSKLDVLQSLVLSLSTFKFLSELTHKDRNFSEKHEYFLYQYAFRTFKESIYKFTDLKQTLKNCLDDLGWDRLLKGNGLAPSLFNRYSELKQKMGRKESRLGKIYDYATNVYSQSGEFNLPPLYKASSSAAASRGGGLLSSKNLGGLFVKLNNLHKFKVILDERAQFKKFQEKVAITLNSKPQLENLSKDIFIRDFATYYALAKGELNGHSFPLKNLIKLSEQSDFFIKTLIEFLVKFHKNPSFYKETKDLLTDLRVDNWRNINKEYLINNQSEFRDFLIQLAEKELHTEINSRILAPVLDNIVLFSTVDTLLRSSDNLVNPLFASVPGALQAPLKIAKNALHKALMNPAYSLLYPYLPTLAENPKIRALLNSSFEGSKFLASVKIGATLAGAYCLPTLAKSALTNLFSLAVNTSDFTNSTVVQVSALALPLLSGYLVYKYSPESIPTIHLQNVLPGTYITGAAAKVAIKCVRAYRQKPVVKTQIVKPIESRIAVDFSCLLGEEEQLNTFFENKFDRLFIEKPADLSTLERKVNHYSTLPTDSSPIVSKFKKVNESIDAFYNHPDSVLSQFTLQSNEHVLDTLEQLYLEMALYEQDFSLKIKTEQDGLVSFLKTNLSFYELHALFHNKQNSFFDSWKKEDIELIELAIGRIDYRMSRLHQMQRILSILKTLSALKDKNDRLPIPKALLKQSRFINQLELLAIELKKTTQFSLLSTPPLLLKLNLEFQAFSKMMLRARQAKTRETVLYPAKKTGKNPVTEEPPGEGKTEFGIVVTAAHISCEGGLAIPIIPRQLSGVVLPKISAQLRSIFNQSSPVTLQFSRDTPYTSENFAAIFAMMKSAKADGDALLTTKEDAQTLASIFIERWHNYRNTPGPNPSDEKASLIYIHKILKLLTKHGVAIPDEAHELYNHLQILNFPLGKVCKIEKGLYMMAEKMIALMTKDEELFSYIRKNELFNLSLDHYLKVIQPRLANKISFDADLKILPEQRQQFIDFLCDNGHLSQVPQWITKDHELYKKYSTIKGMVDQLFKMTRQQRALVEYSATESNQEFAGPNQGNSFRVEGDTIKCPYQTLAKTFFLYLAGGLSSKQSASILTQLKRLNYLQAAKDHINLKTTPFMQKYGHLFDPVSDQLNEIDFTPYSHNTDLILAFIRIQVYSTINYWEEVISNDSFFFDALFKKAISCTGTPFNSDIFPQRLKLLAKPEVMGEMLHTVAEKTNGIYVLAEEEPVKILDEMLKSFFPVGKPLEYGMIIDGGALFTGMKNRQVAEQMMKYFELNNPDIQTVKYFDKDALGKEVLFCLQRDSKEAVAAKSLNIKVKTCVTYYSQRQGFGADVPQDKNGLNTLGPNHSDYTRLQQFFRNRATRHVARLQVESESKPVSNSWVMTKSVQKLILNREGAAFDPNRIPTLQEISEYAAREEARISEQENFPAVVMQLSAIVKKTAYHKILSVKSENFKEWMRLTYFFSDLFVTKFQADPSKLFGLLTKTMNTLEVLDVISGQLLQKVKSNKGFSEDDYFMIEGEFKQLLHSESTPPLPIEVKVMIDGHHFQLAPINEQQSVQQSATQKQQQQTSEKVNLNQNENEQMSLPNQKFKYAEWHFPLVEEPSSLKWLNFADPKPQSFGIFGKISRILFSHSCPIFTVTSLAEVAENNEIKAIANDLDKRLWIPNNFLPRHIREMGEKAIDLGSCHQFNLNQVLIHFVQKEDGHLSVQHMGPLSRRDAGMWQKKLNMMSEDYWEDNPIKVVLWDVTTRSFVAGYNVDQAVLREHEDMNILITQLMILDGSNYIKHEIPFLQKWLLQGKEDNLAGRIKAAYDVINRARRDVPNSPLSLLTQTFYDYMICPPSHII